MAKLDRILTLVHCLADSTEGLTLDEMADSLGVNRRTAERMRDIVARHFELDELTDERRKRFRIRGSLRRFYTRPNAPEIAALQTEIDVRKREGAPQARLLESLLEKIKSAFDGQEKSRIEPDLDPLVNLQRSLFTPGPMVQTDPDVLATAQQAIVMGHCLEFDYQADGSDQPRWRRVAAYGLIHGPVSYLVGHLPDYVDPVPFRLDRMQNARVSDLAGAPPDEWSLDAWMERSASIWREEEHEIVLRVFPDSIERARQWRFHPRQVIEEDGDCLIVRFKSGGLWQIADHVFSWGGGVAIVSPQELREVMVDRVAAASEHLSCHPSDMT